MEGLCRLVEASSWSWSLLRCDSSGLSYLRPPIHGGFDSDGFSLYLKSNIQIKACHYPSLAFPKTHVTQVVNGSHSDQDRNGPQNQSLCEELNIGATLMSFRPSWDGGEANLVSIYRKPDASEFTPRETKISHIILSEVPWLHFQNTASTSNQNDTRLQPRHRAVLNCLCEGWGRKKIADYLNLSINTVNSYSKVVYAHFKVNSQSELVARLRDGNGGDI
jgi:DNA-binding CsgD family transcriptional regulator